MNLFYIDDSRQTPFSVHGGFIITEENYVNLCGSLTLLKNKHGLKAHDPIKFSPKKEKGYSAQRNIRDQNKFKTEVLALFNC